MRSNQFDEMQTRKRNEIGNQTFSLLVILLMLDTLAYNLGFRWMKYPTNVFLIVLVCCGVYFIRSVLHGAFAAPGQKRGKTISMTLGIMALSMAAVTIVSSLFGRSGSTEKSQGGGLLLAAVSGGILLVGVVIQVVKNRKERREENK